MYTYAEKMESMPERADDGFYQVNDIVANLKKLSN